MVIHNMKKLTWRNIKEDKILLWKFAMQGMQSKQKQEGLVPSSRHSGELGPEMVTEHGHNTKEWKEIYNVHTYYLIRCIRLVLITIAGTARERLILHLFAAYTWLNEASVSWLIKRQYRTCGSRINSEGTRFGLRKRFFFPFSFEKLKNIVGLRIWLKDSE